MLRIKVSLSKRSFHSSFQSLKAKSVLKSNSSSSNNANSQTKYFGKESANLSSGIVGLANVGKSTFFQVITKSPLGNPANYPFATIEPSEARVQVPSPRLTHLQELYQSKNRIISHMRIFDIAGLIRNCSKGEGLGNQFLNDIRSVDSIFHLVRGFRADDIIHVEENVDPVRDLEIVFDELLLKDMEFLDGYFDKSKKNSNNPNLMIRNSSKAELQCLEKVQSYFVKNEKLSATNFSWDEIKILNSFNFFNVKPIVFILNVSLDDYIAQKNEFLPDIEEWIHAYHPGSEVVLFNPDFEAMYNECEQDSAQQKKFIQEMGRGSSLPEIIYKMRRALNLISFFTCGQKEVREWTVRENSLAPTAASVIHTDFKKNFINAKVSKYDELVASVEKKSLKIPIEDSQLKSKGKLVQSMGKDYAVQDGDIINFMVHGAKTR